MGRVYATTGRPDDKPILAYIECDTCGAKAKPGTAELLEDWTKVCLKAGDALDVWYYCGPCKPRPR